MSGEPEGADSAGRHLAWLAHPVTACALVVLLVNDHLLKSAYPGLLTGKLSDLAGLVLAPALLASLVTLLLRRAPAELVAIGAVVVTGAGFAIVKALPAAAAAASAAWSVVGGPSVVRADLTDLLTLPALGLAWLAWTRARRRPASGRMVRAVRLAVIVPMALAGVVATSKAESTVPYAVGVGPGLGGHTAVLVARVDGDMAGRRYEIVLASRDGRSWRSSYEALQTATPAQIDAAVETAQATRPMACAADGDRCWRVVPGQLAVEESVDGATWTTVWAMSGAQRERYRQAIAEDAREVPDYHLDDLDREMACTSVSIVAGTGTVVAACGLAGFVSRGRDGTWTMLGFDGRGPDLATANDGYQQIVILISGLLILLVGAEVHALRHPRGSSPGIRQTLAILIAFPSLLCMGRGGGDLDFMFWPLALVFLAFQSVMTVAWLGSYFAGRRAFPWWTVPPAVLGPAVAGSVHTLVVRGQVHAMPAWIGIWSVLAVALAVAIALGLLIRPAGLGKL